MVSRSVPGDGGAGVAVGAPTAGRPTGSSTASAPSATAAPTARLVMLLAIDQLSSSSSSGPSVARSGGSSPSDAQVLHDPAAVALGHQPAAGHHGGGVGAARAPGGARRRPARRAGRRAGRASAPSVGGVGLRPRVGGPGHARRAGAGRGTRGRSGSGCHGVPDGVTSCSAERDRQGEVVRERAGRAAPWRPGRGTPSGGAGRPPTLPTPSGDGAARGSRCARRAPAGAVLVGVVGHLVGLVGVGRQVVGDGEGAGVARARRRARPRGR